jgi:hypothetical protein
MNVHFLTYLLLILKIIRYESFNLSDIIYQNMFMGTVYTRNRRDMMHLNEDLIQELDP